ncbi:MAG: hypothetical protein CMJ18_24495 [Phycisphaeraceae bacterium]|nr:hypothetical protein [Phycisphaeraceae bacterium]
MTDDPRAGGWSMQWPGAPTGDRALLMLVIVVAGIWVLVRLYRADTGSLSPRVRIGLTALRLVAAAGVIAMLLEPVLVLNRTRWKPSNVIVLLDRSASMELADAWPDAAAATSVAERLGLPGGAEALRQQSRSSLAAHVLENGLAERLADDQRRLVRVHGFTERLDEQPQEPSANPNADPGADPSADPNGVNGVQPAVNDVHPDSEPAEGDDPAAASSHARPDGPGLRTAIGSAIEQAVAAYRGQPMAGLVLISDGQSNAGPSPVAAARHAGAERIPIAVIAMGTTQGPRNALITLETSPIVFIRDPIELRAVVGSTGLDGTEASIVLERRVDGGVWEAVDQRMLPLGEGGPLQEIVFDYRHDTSATIDFRARVETDRQEINLDDNVDSAQVQVIRRQIRVLLVAGTAFPEIQFLRNALMRDAGASMSSWLQSADEAYEHMGDLMLRRLPVTQKELDDYDCVILYDPDPARWPANFTDLLNRFVGRAGGGLVYIAGERSGETVFDHDRADGALLDLMPVVREAGLFRTDVDIRLSARNAWRLAVTSDGRADPIFRFDTDAQRNDRILASLPGMFWHFPVTRAKPGATILARHGDPRMRSTYGPHVLMATQLYGPGRTFFMGFDSTYRWRYLDEQYFDGFWARVVDRAGRNKLLGGRYPFRLATDQVRYEPGARVTLTAQFIHPDEIGGSLDALFGQVEHGSDEPVPLTLTPDQDGPPGLFTTSFTVSRPGPWFVKVWSGAPTGDARAATHQFEVRLPDVERERPQQDRATLQDVADASGGRLFDLSEIKDLERMFTVDRVALIQPHHVELWDSAWLWCPVLLAIFAEWVLRKRYRLV